MRSGMLLLLFLPFLAASGCTSMLLGGASSGESGRVADGRSDAQVAADNAISADIRRKLGADDLVREFAIGIRTADYVVTLSGTVGSFAARDRAVQIATGTPRVASVRNRIVVNTNL